MRAMIRLVLATTAMLFALQGVASAQILVGTDTRCQGATSVTSPMAQARYAWALRCHDNPPPPSGGMTYTPEQWLTAASVADYNNPVNAAARPVLYPVYYNFVFGTIWNAPDNALADCLLRPNPATNVGLCTAGCYLESERLQFADGNIGIKSAFQAGKTNLVTLSPDATLDNLSTITNKVDRYSVDLVDDWQTIFTLTMASGGSLKVTDEHPLLTSDGVIHQAKGLKVGDHLVRSSGKADPIVSISVAKVFTKVWNVKPVITDYASNIVIANGYLNGSVRFQNEFLDQVNSLILRRAFAEHASKLN